jgi:methionine sulfoxide reductase heme-binding subunit
MKNFPWLRILVHVVGWLPLAIIIYDYATNNLTVNPIQDIEQRLGRIAIYFLAATLAVTPTYTITGWQGILKRRRALGLYAFLYTCLHLLVFAGLDYGFNLSQVYDLVVGKLYLLVGILSLLLLIPLAITSFDYFIRRMGKNWKRLHWLVYPAAVVAILHYGLAQKGDLFTLRGHILKPFLWGLLTILLLVLRIPPVRRWVSMTRRRMTVWLQHFSTAGKIDSGKKPAHEKSL